MSVTCGSSMFALCSALFIQASLVICADALATGLQIRFSRRYWSPLPSQYGVADTRANRSRPSEAVCET